MNQETSTAAGKKLLLISPYWKEEHRWMVSSVKLAELWFRKLGHDVLVVCMASVSLKEKVYDKLEIHTRKDFFFADPWNYGISFGFSGYVSKLVKTFKPDLIVVNKLLFWTTLSLIFLRFKGHKVLLLTDALVGMTWWPRGWLPKICAAIYAWTLGWIILLFASKVVFFHPQPPSLLRRLGISKKSLVIPTGIDPGPYSDADKLRAAENNINVTYVGRLESVKGVDDFLAAAVPLKKEFPLLSIQVVGWAKANHPLLAQYSEYPEIFKGLSHDIATILSKTHIFVLPSYSEGLSNALMEAMASGCACIASDVGGNRFLIQNGVSGFLFPAGDREALKSLISKLLIDSHKREALGRAARERIEKEFSWEIVGKKYKNLFENL